MKKYILAFLLLLSPQIGQAQSPNLSTMASAVVNQITTANDGTGNINIDVTVTDNAKPAHSYRWEHWLSVSELALYTNSPANEISKCFAHAFSLLLAQYPTISPAAPIVTMGVAVPNVPSVAATQAWLAGLTAQINGVQLQMANPSQAAAASTMLPSLTAQLP